MAKPQGGGGQFLSGHGAERLDLAPGLAGFLDEAGLLRRRRTKAQHRERVRARGGRLGQGQHRPFALEQRQLQAGAIDQPTRVLRLDGETRIDGTIIVYLNRLSDLLFTLARVANAAAGQPDVPWQGRR